MYHLKYIWKVDGTIKSRQQYYSSLFLHPTNLCLLHNKMNVTDHIDGIYLHCINLNVKSLMETDALILLHED